MCKLCASVFILLATLAVSQAFFLPVFYSSRKQPQTPAVQNSISSVGWNGHPAQPSYKDYNSYSPPMTPLHPVPMASVPQYSYESPSIASAMASYHMQPQFHNVQLVPCMCPLTRDVIEQQYQTMMGSAGSSAAQTGSADTQSANVQTSIKTT